MDKDDRFLSERLRDELRVFCYRMSGSLHDAEELVETTLFRVSGLPIPLTDTAATRTELHKVTTRICLGELADRPARGLPSLTHPPSDPYLPPLQPEEYDFWVEPFPDDLYPEPDYAGDKRYSESEGITLSFIAALQELPPRARASLVLSEVMGWTVNVLAEVMGIGVVDARHTLDEAREAMARSYKEEHGRRESPPEEEADALSMRYLHSWETGDVDGLMERLTADIVLQLPPSPSWYEGRDAVSHYLSSQAQVGGGRSRWRLLPRHANGQPAFGVYAREGGRDIYRAHSIQVLRFEGALIGEVISFAYPEMFPLFRLFPEVTAR